jgi:hypothetical protein
MCYSWTPIQKKGEIRLWQGGVHEAQRAWSLRFTLEVFIWVHVVYVPKSSTTFRGILICVIVRPRDMQEYILMFSIALEWRCKYKYYTMLYDEYHLLWLETIPPIHTQWLYLFINTSTFRDPSRIYERYGERKVSKSIKLSRNI